jgi:hypothetical protein
LNGWLRTLESLQRMFVLTTLVDNQFFKGLLCPFFIK